MYLPVAGYFFTLIIPEAKEKGTYQSSLYKMDSHHLYISAPRLPDNRYLTDLGPGTKVILDYRDDKDIPCRFETVVDELPNGSSMNMLVLKCPQIIERHQRREKVRVPVSWPISLQHGPDTFSATMNDLSGGGISAWIPTRIQLSNGDKIQIRFDLNAGRYMTTVQTDAEVVSVHAMDTDDKEYLCSLKFLSLEEALRLKIVEYVFDRQKLDIALHQIGTSVVF